MILGTASVAATMALLAAISVLCTVRFAAFKAPLGDADADADESSGSNETPNDPRRYVTRALVYLFDDGLEWRDVTAGSRFTARFGKLFEAYSPSRHSFLVFDLFMSALTGVLGSLMPDSPAACHSVLVLMCVLAGVYALALALLRPYSGRLDTVLAITVAVCGFGQSVMAVLDLSAEVAATSAAVVYVSLLSVAQFIVHVLLSSRAHRRLPFLLDRVRVLLVASAAPAAHLSPGRASAATQPPNVAMLPDPVREQQQDHLQPTAPSVVEYREVPAGSSSLPVSGPRRGVEIVFGEVSERTRRRGELLRAAHRLLAYVIKETERHALARRRGLAVAPPSQQRVAAALETLVECAARSRELDIMQ
jgi:hypothetical protein